MTFSYNKQEQLTEYQHLYPVDRKEGDDLLHTYK